MPTMLAIIAGLSVINPLLGIAFLVGSAVTGAATAITIGTLGHIKKEKEKKRLAALPPAPVPVEKAVAVIKDTSNQVKKIAASTIKQREVVAVSSASLQHSTKHLNQSSNTIQKAANTIETQTESAQNNLNEITRLRSSLSSTNAALRASQQAIAAREAELHRLLTEARVTNISLQSNATAHEASSVELINRSLRAQAALQSNIVPLITSKQAEIELLRREVDNLKASLRTVNSELNERIRLDAHRSSTNQAPATSHGRTSQTPGVLFTQVPVVPTSNASRPSPAPIRSAVELR